MVANPPKGDLRAAPPPPAAPPEKGRSLWQDAWRRLRRNRLALVSAAFIVLVMVAGYSAPLLSAHLTHFSPDEQHLGNQPPGTMSASIEFPTYDGDKAAFDVVDLDHDGFLTCHFVRQTTLPHAFTAGFEALDRLAPTLGKEARAGFAKLDEDFGFSSVVAVATGHLSCPELDLADEIATQHYDNLINTYDVARADAEPTAQLQKDGYLNWHEFPHSDRDLPKQFRGLGLAGPDAFRALDVDGDHVVSSWEITVRTRYLRYSKKPPGEQRTVEPFVRAYDVNHDLRISRDEFPGAPELRTHVFGTDPAGRDVLTRLLYGARMSITIGLLATLVSLFIGVIYGATSGYVGGRTDNVMMRIVDVLYGLPFMFLVILLMVMFGKNIVVLFLALGAVQWLNMARVVRGQVMSLKTREFVEAARALGASTRTIIFKHLIRNAVGPVVVYATLLVPAVILEETFLSFLGLLPAEVTWGKMLAEALEVFKLHAWLIVYPGIALALTLFAMNFLGDGVRDAIDPKQG
ncbi:MAG: ABC transporter permease subunit [Myxococcales bacterium]|nr:ABC transporter permease subunit [Myxococcales bacterium]MCB9734382.1 ABC transporter permease subunit [Deltaproteobacteria bacterium]